MRRKLAGLNICFIVTVVVLAVWMDSYAQPGPPKGIHHEKHRKGDKLSREKFRGPDRVFEKMDTDNDGYVTKKEMHDFRERHPGAKNKTADKNERNEPYPDLEVLEYNKEKTFPGNVIFVDKLCNRVVEADLKGHVVWECSPPKAVSGGGRKESCGSKLTDVELLPNGNVLVLVGGMGAYEINRDGDVVWSYENDTVSHAADRLQNGNTIMACSLAERKSEFPYEDPQAIEVTPRGEVVWAWYAKNGYVHSRYRDVRSEDANDWTHLNSVHRLDDGNTLLSVRNWNLLIAVDKNGKTVWKTGSKTVPKRGGFCRESPSAPHTPVMLDNGNIILCEPINGRVIEWDPGQHEVVWQFPADEDIRTSSDRRHAKYFLRAAHRLPNGNTFVIDSLGRFLEVTPNGTIVWQAKVKNYVNVEQLMKENKKGPLMLPQRSPCFNADRRGLGYYGGR